MTRLGYAIAHRAEDCQTGGRQLAKLAHDRTLNKLLCRHDTLGNV